MIMNDFNTSEKIKLHSIIMQAMEHYTGDSEWGNSTTHNDQDVYKPENQAEVERALDSFVGWHYRNVMFYADAGDSREEAEAGFREHIETPVRWAFQYLNGREVK
jgi:hypothetical protein